MLEIFGKISFDSKAKKGLENPFMAVQAFQAFEFEIVELTSQNADFLLAFDETPPEVFENEQYQVIIYGTCYTLLNSNWFNKNKRLTAEDVFNIYLEKGQDFINHVKGSFCIIINMLANNTVCLYTDPLNVKSVYYAQKNDAFFFSSSLTAICQYFNGKNEKLSVDQQSVIEQTLFNIILDQRTLIKDIYEIEPGTRITVDSKDVQINTYFNAFERFSITGPVLTEKESIEKLRKLFIQNIDLYVDNPENTAVAITGGYDSRTVVSLLGNKRNEFEYFSYGLDQSWDITIPKKIASELKLDYNPILLDESFNQSFSDCGERAALLGDGIGEVSQANIIYVYSNFFTDKSSILTGLFGSELIKNPTSFGYFINYNIHELLFTDDLDVSLTNIAKETIEKNKISAEEFKAYKIKIIESIRNNKYLNNDLPKSKKLFYYLLMVGMRKYFSKEIKIQKNWVNNLHPFFDIDFINTLLETPFPWVYNYTEKKSLVKNLSIHKLYAHLINSNKVLSNTISTHGFRPKYLLNNLYLPFLVIEYFSNKKLISKQSAFDLTNLLRNEKEKRKTRLIQNASPFYKKLIDNQNLDNRELSKVISMQLWLQSVGLSL